MGVALTNGRLQLLADSGLDGGKPLPGQRPVAGKAAGSSLRHGAVSSFKKVNLK
jgi:hypothetical protein